MQKERIKRTDCYLPFSSPICLTRCFPIPLRLFVQLRCCVCTKANHICFVFGDGFELVPKTFLSRLCCRVSCASGTKLHAELMEK